MSARRASRSGGGSGLPLFPLLIGAVVLLGVVGIAWAALAGGDDDDGAAEAPGGETREVVVEGDALPPFPPSASSDRPDAVAPTLKGEDFAGDPVTIEPDGRAKAVFFVAHWCPHCQAEVPRLASWLEGNELPENVDVYVVSTRVSPQENNYPPSAWLRREGVDDLPTIVDSESVDALLAYGAGGFPYVVYLDGDNNALLRTAGEYPEGDEVYTQIFDALANGGEGLEDPRG